MNLIITGSVLAGSSLTVSGITTANTLVKIVGPGNVELGRTTSDATSGAWSIALTLPDPRPASVQVQGAGKDENLPLPIPLPVPPPIPTG
jgi:hypothetical protein